MEKNMREKQKLDRRDTYTPTDAPQVRMKMPDEDFVQACREFWGIQE